MRKKTIIGLIGDVDAKEIVASFLEKEGFYRSKIIDKVKEVSQYLLKEHDYSEKDLEIVRQRGYNVNKLYWINLTLATVPNNKIFVVIDDIDEKDIINNVIDVYYVGESTTDNSSRNHIRQNDNLKEKLKHILPITK
jgi:hypothetical protein